MSFRRNDKRHFTQKVMTARYAYARGCCEACGSPLRPGHFDYHHDPAWELAGDSSFECCRVWCDICHDKHSYRVAIPLIAKSNRQRAKHIGAQESSRTPLPGGRKTRWSKTFRGKVVPRASLSEKLYAAGILKKDE